MAHEIRMAGDDDFFGWLPLFEAYCEFYETELDDAKALIVWTWIRDEHDPLEAALAVDDEGTPVGLAQFRVVPDTLQATRGIHLDDLYVAEDARGTRRRAGPDRVRPRAVARGRHGRRELDHRRGQRRRAAPLRRARPPHHVGHLRDGRLMRLGTRWAFGDEPPASVPGDLRPRIAAAEAAHAGDGAGRHWTLTWLEGRPIVELDDGTVVSEAIVDVHDADEDW